MATLAASQPRASRSSLAWLLKFLRDELAPYPGRGATVARMTIAATLVMLWIMVFRIPGAALGAYFSLTLARDSPESTLASAVSALRGIAFALCLVAISVSVLIGDPLLHFLWVVGLLFLAFFLISALTDYRSALSLAFIMSISVTYWTFPANTEVLVENTLWTVLAFGVGALVTVAVEFVSQHISPHDQLKDGLRHWNITVRAALDALGNGREVDAITGRTLLQYSMTGGGRLRRLVSRGQENPQRRAEMSAIIVLAGRLIDLTATVVDVGVVFSAEDRQRCLTARDDLQKIGESLALGEFKTCAACDPHPADATNPFLLQIQQTLILMPEVFAGLTPLSAYLPSAIDMQKSGALLKPNAFTDPAHLHFGLKGALATGLCYIVYTSLDWQGLNTSLATCILTALTTVGGSRQRQLFRFVGAVLGAVCLGMSAQAFLLPHINSIADFTILFAAVIALSSWIATSSPRLSFVGLQTAFAFSITQLRTFGPQTSLTVARDDVAGILLGLGAMWLCFDRLWVKNTVTYLMQLFVENMRRMSDFSREVASVTDLRDAITRARSERDAINNQFDLIRNESDALFFEFGAQWQEKVRLRNQIRAWQPQLRTYFLLELSLMHYRLDASDRKLPAQDERCVQTSKELLRLLAEWKESAVDNPIAQPPAALLELLAGSKLQLRDRAREAKGDHTTQGISSSMLNIAAGLTDAMLADSGEILPV